MNADPAATLALDRSAWQAFGARFRPMDDGQGETAHLATASVHTSAGTVRVGVLDYGETTTYLLVPGADQQLADLTMRVLVTLACADVVRIPDDVFDIVDDRSRMTRSTPEQRVARLMQRARSAGLVRAPAPERPRVAAVESSPPDRSAVPSERDPPPLAGFVSFAHQDRDLVERFLDVMRPRVAISRKLTGELWTDRPLSLGQSWQLAIENALDRADFGLVCMTPAFLASSYLPSVELPALVAAHRIIPVALEPFDSSWDLGGLDARQIFRLRRPSASDALSFAECSAINARRFCDELAVQMVALLRAGRPSAMAALERRLVDDATRSPVGAHHVPADQELREDELRALVENEILRSLDEAFAVA